jgi:hemoglobin
MHTIYEQMGGAPALRALTRAFYRRLAEDPLLRSLYPEDDLGPAEERLGLFLIQYWGGPATYSERRGHPRLRMRHAPFAIGTAEREAWLAHMRAALDEQALPQDIDEELWAYFQRAAAMLQNRMPEAAT